MKFHDPRGERSGPTVPYELSAHLAPGQQIGLFANGFPGSVEFLQLIGEAVERVIPGITVKLWNKGNRAPSPPPKTSLKFLTHAPQSSRHTAIEAVAPPAPCVTASSSPFETFQPLLS